MSRSRTAHLGRDPRQSAATTARDLDDAVVLTQEGELRVYPPSDDETHPTFSVHAGKGRVQSRAERESEGTYDKTYNKEGLITNPTSIWPASFFTPSPPVIRGLFSGPLSIIENPELIIAIIGVVAVASATGSTETPPTYSTHYNNLPLQVIDNEELEDVLT